jgi:fermentation-respiration switch protein FrsA (DUF1100 family)
MLLKLFLILLVTFFLIILIIKRFVYFQPSYSFTKPLDNYQDIYEGNLHAWYKKGSSGTVILFCHGNAGNLSFRQNKLIPLQKMGHSVLIFDYSGFGQSKGVPNEQLCYANATMFINYLQRQGYKLENIVPYGESLGASVASYIALKFKLPKVILESSLPGVSYYVKNKFKYLPFLSIFFNEFDTVSYLKSYSGKSLVIHSTEDDIIPYDMVEPLRLVSSIFIEVKGTHNSPEIPWSEIENFLK